MKRYFLENIGHKDDYMLVLGDAQEILRFERKFHTKMSHGQTFSVPMFMNRPKFNADESLLLYGVVFTEDGYYSIVGEDCLCDYLENIHIHGEFTNGGITSDDIDSMILLYCRGMITKPEIDAQISKLGATGEAMLHYYKFF